MAAGEAGGLCLNNGGYEGEDKTFADAKALVAKDSRAGRKGRLLRRYLTGPKAPARRDPCVNSERFSEATRSASACMRQRQQAYPSLYECHEGLPWLDALSFNLKRSVADIRN